MRVMLAATRSYPAPLPHRQVNVGPQPSLPKGALQNGLLYLVLQEREHTTASPRAAEGSALGEVVYRPFVGGDAPLRRTADLYSSNRREDPFSEGRAGP
jgi:hypothetical protein